MKKPKNQEEDVLRNDFIDEFYASHVSPRLGHDLTLPLCLRLCLTTMSDFAHFSQTDHWGCTKLGSPHGNCRLIKITFFNVEFYLNLNGLILCVLILADQRKLKALDILQKFETN